MKKFIVCVGVGVFLGLTGCGTQNDQSKEAKSLTPPVAIRPAVPAVSQELEKGIAYLKDGQAQEAMVSLKNAIAQDPRNTQAHFLLARLYMNVEEYEQAIRHFLAVIQIEPNNGEAYLLIAGCYDLMGNTDAAVSAVEQSLNVFQQNRDEENLTRALAILQVLQNKKGETANP